MLSSLKISLKILLSMVLIALLTSVILSIVSRNTTQSIIQQAEERELQAYRKQLNAMLEKQAFMAVSMATQIAGLPSVQKAMAEQNRSLLADLFVPSFAEMKSQHDVRQFQFHLPPATSFLRVHKPEKHSDDLSSFRFSVIETNKNKTKISGLEIGVAGLGMRGIAPISHQGQHVGSVEFGLSFGKSFFDDFKNETGANVALILKRGSQYDLFATTFPDNSMDITDSSIIQGIEDTNIINAIEIEGKSYARMVSPVQDFSGNPIGILVLAIDRSYFVEQSNNALMNTLAVLSAVLVGVFVLAYFINKSITRPITELTDTMQIMANGQLDIPIPATDRKDEIGSMASAVKFFKSSGLEKIKLEKQAEEERIAARQREIAQEKAEQEAQQKAAMEKAERARAAEEQLRQERIQLANDFENQVGEIVNNVSVASIEMSEIAETMSEVARNSSSKAQEALKETQTSNASVQSVASASEELFTAIQEVSGQLANATSVTNNAVTQAQSAERNMYKLQEAGTRINDVVGLINDIAEQTNLLALNATIEAARAGDAGRGFAVVANEVKTLATQTAKATEEITAQITDMQTVTNDAVDSVKLIGNTISEVNDISTAIASAAEEQAAATQEINQSTQRAATGTQTVIANIELVSNLSQQSGTSSMEVLEASRGLTTQAGKLKEELASFLNNIRGRG
ncbi:methyl-accepting chemotaxis protein [Sneathiella limimaris]|uniref:methyl-accepting chemotaxis protein n=1 Tax=Sneathiella limimaris TaxID=1964213 RepID=UPI00146F4045|nr:cache domain-containing protein [Sneathiella limimaris]